MQQNKVHKPRQEAFMESFLSKLLLSGDHIAHSVDTPMWMTSKLQVITTDKLHS